MIRDLKALCSELQSDHHAIAVLLGRLQEAHDPSRRHRLVDDLLRQILPHMIAEEQVIYPALCADPEGRRDALHFMEQHRSAQEHLEELASTSPVDVRFRPRVHQAREEIETHFREEEFTLFADLERIVTSREAHRILNDFRRERDLARKKYPDLSIRADEREFRI